MAEQHCQFGLIKLFVQDLPSSYTNLSNFLYLFYLSVQLSTVIFMLSRVFIITIIINLSLKLFFISKDYKIFVQRLVIISSKIDRVNLQLRSNLLKLHTCYAKVKGKYCVHNIFFAHSRDNAMSYLNLLALFIYKIKNDPTNIPAIFSGTLTLASEVHIYNTRFVTNFNIYRPSVSNNYGATMFSFVVSKIWESIPFELKKLSCNHFYMQYKMYLLNTQSVSLALSLPIACFCL